MQSAMTKPSHKLTLKDRLSQLTLVEASKLLGPDGGKIIRKAANQFDIKIDDDVYFAGDLFRLRLQDKPPAVVTITLMAEAKNRLHWNCTRCTTACTHVGAAFSLIL